MIKGNFWRKIFRRGYNASGKGSAQYNGVMAKTDSNSSRAKLDRYLKTVLEFNL